MEVPHLLKMRDFRKGSDNPWIPDEEKLFLAHINTNTHTQTCLFCSKAPKMFERRACRKTRLRTEELIKQEKQDVWSHSFTLRLVQLQNICNKAHRFTQVQSNGKRSVCSLLDSQYESSSRTLLHKHTFQAVNVSGNRRQLVYILHVFSPIQLFVVCFDLVFPALPIVFQWNGGNRSRR